MPFVDGVDDSLYVGVAGEEYADGVRLHPSRLAEQRVALHTGHPLVGEYQVHFVPLEQFDRLPAPAGREYPKIALQRNFEGLKDVGLVIHHQNGTFRRDHKPSSITPTT